MAGKFELYKDKAGDFRFRLKAGNGENIGASQAYKTRAAAMKGIESVRTNAADGAQFAEKKGNDGKIYFTLHAKNHQVILSSQGYSTEAAAKNGITSIMGNGPDAVLVEI